MFFLAIQSEVNVPIGSKYIKYGRQIHKNECTELHQKLVRSENRKHTMHQYPEPTYMDKSAKRLPTYMMMTILDDYDSDMILPTYEYGGAVHTQVDARHNHKHDFRELLLRHQSNRFCPPIRILL